MKEKKGYASTGELDPFSKFIGRIETEIEVYAHYVLGCTPEELTARVGRALVGLVAQPELHVAKMPRMRTEAVKVDQRLRKVALGGGPRGEGTHAPTAKKKRKLIWWDKLTRKQKDAVIEKRKQSHALTVAKKAA